MEIKVYNKLLEPVGVADEMESVIWSPSYWNPGAPGDVKILCPPTENNNKIFVKGNILILHGEDAEYEDEAGEWKRAAQITYRHIAKNEQGIEQVEVQGCFLKRWLAKRLVIKEGTITATNQNIINALVKENCGADAEEKRKFGQFVMLTQDDMGGTTVEYAREYGLSLADAVYDRALVGKLGYDILVNAKKKMYGFWLYKGDDLSAKNMAGNEPCIFSRDSDNVNEQEYTESIENVKNVAYIIGASDEDGNQPKAMEIKGTEAEGIEREELFVEATDIARKEKNAAGEETEIPIDRYKSMMKQKGCGTLEECGEVVNFLSRINTSQNLQYKKDYRVGDIVTSREERWGVSLDARITAIRQTFQKGKETIEVTFGESTPTLKQQIKRAAGK